VSLALAVVCLLCPSEPVWPLCVFVVTAVVLVACVSMCLFVLVLFAYVLCCVVFCFVCSVCFLLLMK
jgi:hypothetical protein